MAGHAGLVRPRQAGVPGVRRLAASASAGGGGLSCVPIWRRIPDGHERQPLGRSDRNLVGPGGAGQQGVHPLWWATAITDREQRPHQRSHHGMAKRVGLGSAADLPTGLTADFERLQCPNRRTAHPQTAERGEVVLAEQAPRAAGHRSDIQRTAPTEHDMAAQWTHPGLGIVDAIDIAPPQRGEPGVEIRRHLSNAQDTYIRWQYSSQAAQRGWCKVRPDSRREVGMRDLARSVHPGISSASNRQLDGRDAGNALERGLDDALDRSSSGLHGPARECPSVIAQIQPNANEPAVPDRGSGLVATQLTTSTD
jgi:hypothetical protein